MFILYLLVLVGSQGFHSVLVTGDRGDTLAAPFDRCPEIMHKTSLDQFFLIRPLEAHSWFMVLLSPRLLPDNPHFCSLPTTSKANTWTVCGSLSTGLGNSAFWSDLECHVSHTVHHTLDKMLSTWKKVHLEAYCTFISYCILIFLLKQ